MPTRIGAGDLCGAQFESACSGLVPGTWPTSPKQRLERHLPGCPCPRHASGAAYAPGSAAAAGAAQPTRQCPPAGKTDTRVTQLQRPTIAPMPARRSPLSGSQPCAFVTVRPAGSRLRGESENWSVRTETSEAIVAMTCSVLSALTGRLPRPWSTIPPSEGKRPNAGPRPAFSSRPGSRWPSACLTSLPYPLIAGSYELHSRRPSRTTVASDRSLGPSPSGGAEPGGAVAIGPVAARPAVSCRPFTAPMAAPLARTPRVKYCAWGRSTDSARSLSSRGDVTRDADGTLGVGVGNPEGASGQLGPRQSAVRPGDRLEIAPGEHRLALLNWC
jgi:hypothetical protein